MGRIRVLFFYFLPIPFYVDHGKNTCCVCVTLFPYHSTWIMGRIRVLLFYFLNVSHTTWEEYVFRFFTFLTFPIPHGKNTCFVFLLSSHTILRGSWEEYVLCMCDSLPIPFYVDHGKNTCCVCVTLFPYHSMWIMGRIRVVYV